MEPKKQIFQTMKELFGTGRDLTGAFHSAIIVAGGSGSRMGSDIPKQLIPVAGLPVAVRSVNAFEACEWLDEIILVGREEDLPQYEAFRMTYGWKKVKSIVKGGGDRRASVLCGFRCISDQSDYVHIHDAARCLITPEMITAVARDVCRYGAACAAQKARDTVKLENSGFIADQPDRNHVWYAATPQSFRTEMYRAAAYTAQQTDDPTITDDCGLVGRLGFPIHLTDCGSENIKVTYPEDIAIAEAILGWRAKREKDE